MLADTVSSCWPCLPGSICPGWMFPNDLVRGSRASTAIGSISGSAGTKYVSPPWAARGTGADSAAHRAVAELRFASAWAWPRGISA